MNFTEKTETQYQLLCLNGDVITNVVGTYSTCADPDNFSWGGGGGPRDTYVFHCETSPPLLDLRMSYSVNWNTVCKIHVSIDVFVLKNRDLSHRSDRQNVNWWKANYILFSEQIFDNNFWIKELGFFLLKNHQKYT